MTETKNLYDANLADDAEVLRIFNELTLGIRPADGLIETNDEPWNLQAAIFTHSRVASWSQQGIVEAEIVKVKTMHDPTEKGRQLEDRFLDIGLPQKDTSMWRIKHPILRRISFDELPQLFCNVLGLGRSYFPNLMDMDLVGPGRPVLQNEIVLKGDNSNDLYNSALEEVAEVYRISREAMHWVLGGMFRPALLSTATAGGHRQLSSIEGYRAWIKGITDFNQINQMPAMSRKRAVGNIMMKSFRHVANQVDAV